MSSHTIASSAVLDAPAEMVFATITDVAGLPDWNAAITEVVELPERLEVGAEWTVGMHALGQHWHSRSVVDELDVERRRFGYRSATDDGNPSYALWRWEVADHPEGADVTVSVNLNPRTFWRRALLIWIRKRQLTRTELPGSLASLRAATTIRSERRRGHPDAGSG